MKISSEKKGIALIIRVNEENIDISNAFEFREGLTKESEKSDYTIILDMSKIKYLDSSGLGVLITFLNDVRDNEKELKLANCSKKVMGTMKSTKLDDEFSLYDSLDDALK
jgi:anti-sigma B factor antagonist